MNKTIGCVDVNNEDFKSCNECKYKNDINACWGYRAKHIKFMCTN